jgi:ABC-type dipeptide/oligopeptide/nickel transport system ATPase subunit
MNPLLKVENVSYFIDKAKPILSNISFELNKGEILGIAGESGSGKTTLGRIIAGLITPSEGKIIFTKPAGWEKIRVSPIQILFQNNGEILNPFRRIDSVVKEALKLRKGGIINWDEETEKIFLSLDLKEDLRKRKGYELSGGEQQRGALARLLAVKPVLLILDEPFSAQDPDSQYNFLDLFKKINSNMGVTLICISHNLRILKELCNNLLIIYRGTIVEGGECGTIFDKPSHPYTRFLFKADSYKLTYDELKNETFNISEPD